MMLNIGSETHTDLLHVGILGIVDSSFVAKA